MTDSSFFICAHKQTLVSCVHLVHLLIGHDDDEEDDDLYIIGAVCLYVTKKRLEG